MQGRKGYLKKKRGIWHFRMRVPEIVREFIQKQEIIISLKTDDLRKAEQLGIVFRELYERQFNYLKEIMLSLDYIRSLVAQEVKSHLDSGERRLAKFGRICQSTIDQAVKEMEFAIKRAKEALITNDLEYLDSLNSVRDALKNEEHDEGDVMTYARERLKGRIFEFTIKKERLLGNYDNEWDSVNYRKFVDNPKNFAIETTAVQEAPKIHHLKEVMDKYIQEKANSKSWDAKSKQTVESMLDLLVEVFGNVDIRSLTHQKLFDFRNNILMKLPARRKLDKRYKNKTVQQIVKMRKVTPMSLTTINNSLNKISSFFKWAAKHEFMDKNIGEGLQVKSNVREDEEREIYSKEDLEKLVLELGKMKWEKKPSHYWVPLIGLFNGMRQTEICQLYLKDIVIKDDIPCFDINDDEDDKKVKTLTGKRIIPINPVLLDLGFMDFIEGLRKKKQARVFEDLEYMRDGYGQRFQRWYGKFNRENITENPQKVFHSFRHTFADNLKQNGAEENKIAEIVGHKVESMTSGRYGKRYKPKVLVKVFSKLNYGIDLSVLMPETIDTPIPPANEELMEQLSKQIQVVEE